MNDNTQNLDEVLECAIREKGAIERMAEIDSTEKIRRKRRMRHLVYGAVACIAVVSVVDFALGNIAKTAGYAFDPTYGQMGGSEITALMQDGKIDEAMSELDEAIAKLEVEMADPSVQDPEYTLQLSNDREELDLLKAVCLMRNGRYFKAKKALKAISEGGGAYAADAGNLLEYL